MSGLYLTRGSTLRYLLMQNIHPYNYDDLDPDMAYCNHLRDQVSAERADGKKQNITKNQIFVVPPCSAEACNEWRDPSPRLSIWTALLQTFPRLSIWTALLQTFPRLSIWTALLQRNVATVTTLCLICPGIES